MTECEGTIRKWGNSFGIVIPKEIAEEENVKENEKIKFLILRDNKALKESFGMLRGRIKKSAQQIKDELRADLYD